jgi:hypothetical protein
MDLSISRLDGLQASQLIFTSAPHTPNFALHQLRFSARRDIAGQETRRMGSSHQRGAARCVAAQGGGSPLTGSGESNRTGRPSKSGWHLANEDIVLEPEGSCQYRARNVSSCFRDQPQSHPAWTRIRDHCTRSRFSWAALPRPSCFWRPGAPNSQAVALPKHSRYAKFKYRRVDL